jgi:hypothetical protein
MTRRAVMAALLLLTTGCARPDWIESTLVTADVSGTWTGTWSHTTARGPFELKLRQLGSKVQGEVWKGGLESLGGPVEGTVSGDVLRWSQPNGNLSGELTVGVDEMSGALANRHPIHGVRSRMHVILRRQHPETGGQPAQTPVR